MFLITTGCCWVMVEEMFSIHSQMDSARVSFKAAQSGHFQIWYVKCVGILQTVQQFFGEVKKTPSLKCAVHTKMATKLKKKQKGCSNVITLINSASSVEPQEESTGSFQGVAPNRQVVILCTLCVCCWPASNTKSHELKNSVFEFKQHGGCLLPYIAGYQCYILQY